MYPESKCPTVSRCETRIASLPAQREIEQRNAITLHSRYRLCNGASLIYEWIGTPPVPCFRNRTQQRFVPRWEEITSTTFSSILVHAHKLAESETPFLDIKGHVTRITNTYFQFTHHSASTKTQHFFPFQLVAQSSVCHTSEHSPDSPAPPQLPVLC